MPLPHPTRIGVMYDRWLRDPADYVPPDLDAYREALARAKAARHPPTKPPLDTDEGEDE